jgi:hypothetical protein
MSRPKALAFRKKDARRALAPAQVWLFDDSGRRWRGALGCCLTVIAGAGESSARYESTALTALRAARRSTTRP